MADLETGAVPQHALDEYAVRHQTHQRILDGSLAGTLDLLAGAPWYGSDIRKDMQVWCDSLLLSKSTLAMLQRQVDAAEPGIDVRAVIQNLRDVGTRDALLCVEQVLEICGQTDVTRMQCYRACLDDGDEAARMLLIKDLSRESYDRNGYDNMWTSAVALGLAFHSRKSMHEYCRMGMRMLASDSKPLQYYFDAERHFRDGLHLKAAVQEVAEDAKGILPDPVDDEEVEDNPTAGMMMVVPPLPEGTTSWRKEIYKSWRDWAGSPMPLVGRGDLAGHRRSLVARWPHAAEIIDVILGDLAPREAVRFRPTLLVGAPGSGKSSLARAILETLGVPCELQSFAGLHDAALMGTSAQWGSAREAAPLQLIKRAGVANPGIIWDEIEKASQDRRNGSPGEALLPLLEVDQAKNYRDLCLEVEVDLSMVSHFATANALDDVPAPLRDRMRILHMPTPTWQHLGALTQQITSRLASERGVDVRWFQPLAEDELDLVKEVWPGGSMRQLTRIVTTIVDGREQLMGRC